MVSLSSGVCGGNFELAALSPVCFNLPSNLGTVACAADLDVLGCTVAAGRLLFTASFCFDRFASRFAVSSLPDLNFCAYGFGWEEMVNV